MAIDTRNKRFAIGEAAAPQPDGALSVGDRLQLLELYPLSNQILAASTVTLSRRIALRRGLYLVAITADGGATSMLRRGTHLINRLLKLS